MKRIPIGVGLALAGFMFSQAQQGSGNEGVGYRQFALYVLQETIWPNLNIPVCWENPTRNFTQEMNWVRNAVVNTWEMNSGIRFQGWQACMQNSTGIRIQITDEQPKTVDLGRRIDGVRNGMILNFTFTNFSPSCRDVSRRQNCVESIATHEFGHALGFSHEQNRSDAPEWCRDSHQGADGDIYISPYDSSSVMNYCNRSWNNGGQLSQSDIGGLQIFYNAQQGSGLPWEPDCRQNIVLFQDVNFKGRKLHLRGSISSISQKSFNDEVSSLCVPPGYRLVAYNDDNFQGTSVIYDGPRNILDVRVDGNFNDKFSSFILVNLRNGSQVFETPSSCDNNVVLFEHNELRGDRLVMVAGTGFSNLKNVEVRRFNSDGNLPKRANFNDKASSICIGDGRSIQVWEDDNFRGNTLTLRPLNGSMVILNLVPRGWNDKISSLQVF